MVVSIEHCLMVEMPLPVFRGAREIILVQGHGDVETFIYRLSDPTCHAVRSDIGPVELSVFQ